MTLDELIAEASTFEPTEADIVAMEKRVAKAEAGFAADAEAKRITNEWLNREYTI